ncbi:MAG: TonB-dependent receptor plug domain-containing protein, partial [Phenylobacterium sp.]
MNIKSVRPSRLVLAAALLAWTPAFAQQSPTSVDELVVTGQRASQQQAIDAKRDATAVIDAISADDLGRLADKNVAENLERLPGVGLFYDQGEGRYVSIRGIDSSLSNVTLNGVEVGNPDGLAAETRVPLDVVGGQLLSRLEVVKVVTPDMDAQGIGGSVNLVTQSPFDSKKTAFANVNGQVGYQDALAHSRPWQGDATIGGVFGGGRVGALLGVSGSSRKFRSNGFFPDDWRAAPGERGGLPTTVKYTNYTIKRERVGVSGALEFRPSDTDKFYLRGLYSKFTEDEHRQRFRGDFGSNLANVTFNPDGYTGVAANVDSREDLREEYKEKSITQVAIGGEQERGAWKADYDLAYGYNEVVEPNRLWQFRSVAANTTYDFDMRPLLFTAEPRNLPLSNMGFRQYQEQDENGNEIAWAGRANIRRDIDLGDGGYVKVGAKLRDDDKKFDGRTDVWDRGAGANRFTLADFGANLANITFNADGYTGVARTVDAREDLREEHKEKSISQIAFGGEHERGPWKFDYDLSYGYNEVIEPNRLWQFRSVTANTTVDFDMRPLLFTAEPRNLPASNLGFRQYQEQDENGNETNWAGRASVRYDVDWGDGGFVKFGVKLRDEDKKFDGRTDVW